jgi:hypothetical protein
VREVLSRHIYPNKRRLTPAEDSPLFDVLDADLFPYLNNFVSAHSREHSAGFDRQTSFEEALTILEKMEAKLRTSPQTLRRTLGALRSALIQRLEPSEYTH